MVELNPIISIITLNMSKLNIAIKRPILSDWIFFLNKNQLYLTYEKYLKYTEEVEGTRMEKLHCRKK